MIVYHGTDNYSAENIIKNGIDIKAGKEFADNGQGFYTTPSQAFAARRAIIVTSEAKKSRDNPKPVVLQIEVDESSFDNLNTAAFPECTYKWKEFVFYNRMGMEFLHEQKITSSNHNLDNKFDVVIDETADFGVNKMVLALKYRSSKRNINLKYKISTINKSKKDFWSNQISFHSTRSLQCIKSMHIVEV